jgi:hypothetical protein
MGCPECGKMHRTVAGASKCVREASSSYNHMIIRGDHKTEEHYIQAKARADRMTQFLTGVRSVSKEDV